jgi:hypothetical protein
MHGGGTSRAKMMHRTIGSFAATLELVKRSAERGSVGDAARSLAWR